jgi:hypothetical protein
LGIFAEDEEIPFSLLARLWKATSGLDDPLQVSRLCRRLTSLGLIFQKDNARWTLHDIIRDFLRRQLRPEGLAQLAHTLLDSFAADLPTADSLGLAMPATPGVAWWCLDPAELYIWDHLIEHLMEAGPCKDAEAVAGDLRWVAARLRLFGRAAPATDLARVATPLAAHLRSVFLSTGLMIDACKPIATTVDNLHSRVACDAFWGPQVSALRHQSGHPRMVNRWTPPDLASSQFRCLFKGHGGAIHAVAIAPDGTWLATGGEDWTVRIWHATAGLEQIKGCGRSRYSALAMIT